MGDFLTDLWSSVFTPGATPTLLVATNVTFAALQLVLVTLLVVTYSIHFAVLSVLCGGLWWSINWFAMELRAAQAKEDEAEKLRKRKKEEGKWRSTGEAEDSADDEGEDTEVEERRTGMKESTSSLGRGAGEEDSRIRNELFDAMKDSGRNEQNDAGVGTGAEQAVSGAEVRQRIVEDGDRSGEISTDSEWEKVSQQGDT